MEQVRCPSCGEAFFVTVPGLEECPAEMDYDCEVCCRPFVLLFDEFGHAESRGGGEGFGS